MHRKPKVMLVDDEDSIRRVVEQIIINDGYEFCYAPNGKKALAMFREQNPSLLILDVMLPEINGFELCRVIREDSLVPIIILSAKSDIVDKSVGYTMGADDYISKPFSPEELSLKIKALLRRSAHFDSRKSIEPESDTFRIRDLEINCKRYEIRVRGKKVELTPKEFELLCFMASNPGQVFTREQLYETLWGEQCSGDSGTITVFIRKIREKLEKEPDRPMYIITVWGVGYKFLE